ncbi:hypothetical protein ACN47E_004072 [Coniothyrium glycines]
MAEPQFLALETHLRTIVPESRLSLRQILPQLLQCITEIASTLRSSSKVSQVGTANAFGDDQLNVDVLAEDIIRNTISQCPSIVTASSEEDPVEKSDVSSTDSDSTERYTLAFDPLDGSSIIAPNWTVGTIIGIWDATTALHQNPGEKQIAALLGVEGPRTTAIVALRLPGSAPTCFEVGYGANSELEVVRADVKFQGPPFKTRYFAPANMRAAAEDDRYLKLINHFITQKYTLRYSGGLVPDVVHALVKGHGVYVSPVTEKSKAKLRRLYELTPIALVIECAGGVAVDSADGSRILDRVIEDTDERAGLICGTAEEVEFVKKALIS